MNKKHGDNGMGVISQMLERRQRAGAIVADEFFESGLKRKKYATLSGMESFIRHNHLQDANAVNSGFLDRMKEYIDAGEVLNISVDDGDILFVHRREADDLTHKIQNGQITDYIVQESTPEEQDLKKTQEAKARDVSEFIGRLNRASNVICYCLEKMLPAENAIKQLAHHKRQRVAPTSGWNINAGCSYTGGSRQGFIMVDDPALIRYLQTDNPKVYAAIPAEQKKLFGRGSNFGGYFAFSYNIYAGDIQVSEHRDDARYIRSILAVRDIPATLPALLEAAGCEELAQEWSKITE